MVKISAQIYCEFWFVLLLNISELKVAREEECHLILGIHQLKYDQVYVSDPVPITTTLQLVNLC